MSATSDSVVSSREATLAPFCKALRVTFEPTGWRVDDVYDYRITLDVDCTRADGTALVGKASTTHCH